MNSRNFIKILSLGFHCATALFLLAVPAIVHAQFTFTTNNGAITIIGYTGVGGALTIPDTTNGYAVIGIGDYAFAYSTGLISVTIPNSVTNIGEDVFLGCASLTNISVVAGNSAYSTINGVLFDQGRHTLIVYPEGQTNNAFIISNNVTSIEADAFAYCPSLASISIGKGATNIGGLAFAFCTNLTAAFFTNNAPPDVGNAFYGDPDAFVYYPPGATGWSARFGGVPTIEETAQFEFEYTTNNGSLTITGYVGPVGPVAIPDSINGYPVTSIGSQAFRGNSRMTSVTISNGVTSIGTDAFEYCPGLTDVVILGGVTNIGDEAFAFCTNLTSISLTNNAPPDAGNALYGDPNAVVYYAPGTTGWGTTFGGAPTAEQTPASEFYYETYNGSITITGYRGFSETVAIPSTINGYPVTTLQSQAFFNDVTNVIIPASVTNMLDAFQYSGVTSVTFANGTAAIPDRALEQCGSVTSVIIPDSVTSIGQYAFRYCLGLTNFSIPNTVTSIGDSAFQFCFNLNSITIPNSVTNMTDAFNQCGLTNVTIAIGVTSIGENAFESCRSLASVTIPDSVTNIGVGVFQFCTSLSNVVIPNNVTSIGMDAFRECASLTTIIIPTSVTSLGEGTLADCTSLTNITVGAANPTYGSTNGILFDKAYDTLVQYPAGLTSSVYTIPFGVTNIGGNAFSSCAAFTSVTIPNSVTSIGDFAFQHCANLAAAYFAGNAPPDDGTVFNGDSATIVYYLPGTTGWGTTFGSAPTELWNPQATAFTTAGNQFGFNITGPTNLAIVVEACTNLANPVWLPVSTNTLSGSGTSSFSDPQQANFPRRYYRFSAP